jgi:Ca2+-transporting ATPase
LMIDLMAELIPITALTWDPPENWLMEANPRDVKQHIFNKPVIFDRLWFGLLMWGIGFINYILYFMLHGLSLHGINTSWISYATANAVTYTSIMACQYVNIFSLRTWPGETVFTSYLRSNKKLLRAFLMSFTGILALVYLPIVRNYFSFGSMTLGDRLLPLWAGVVYLIARELKKMRRRHKMSEQVVPVEVLPAINE